MKNPVTYESALRDLAKGESLALVTIDVDGRPARAIGRATFQMAVPVELARELMRYATDYHRRSTAARTPAEG